MGEALATYTTYDGSEFAVLKRPESAVDSLVMRFTITPEAGSPPPHVHPHAIETFEVLEGEFELLMGSEWRRVGAGESVNVPAGMRHTFRNESGAEVVVRDVHAPHHDFETYIAAIARLTQDLKATTPKTPGAAARVAILFDRHSDLIQPADLPLKLAFAVLRTVARVAGIKAPTLDQSRSQPK